MAADSPKNQKLSGLIERSGRIFGQKFGILYLLRILLGLIGSIRKGKVDLKSILLDRSSVRFAASLAGVSAANSFFLRLLPRYLPKQFVASVSGAVSSLFLLIDRDNGRSSTIANIVVVRTLFYLTRAWTYQQPTQLETRHKSLKLRSSSNQVVGGFRSFVDRFGDAFVWTLVSSLFCYYSFVHPTYLSKSFFKSLLVTSGSYRRLGKNCYEYVVATANLNHLLAGQDTAHPIEFISNGKTTLAHFEEHKNSEIFVDLLKGIRDMEKLTPRDMKHTRFLCAVQHPSELTCFAGALGVAKAVYGNMLKTYFVLNMIQSLFKLTGLLVKKYRDRKKVDIPIISMLKKILISTVRSATMITSFLSVFAYAVCWCRYLIGRETLIGYAIGGLIASPTILIDRPGRLTELNPFAMGKLIEILVIYMHRHTFLKYSRFVEALMMAPTLGALNAIIQDYPYALNGFLSPLFVWIMGK